MTAAIGPQLDVTDLEASHDVYVRRLGFSARDQRPEARLVDLEPVGAELRLEEAVGPGRPRRPPARRLARAVMSEAEATIPHLTAPLDAGEGWGAYVAALFESSPERPT